MRLYAILAFAGGAIGWLLPLWLDAIVASAALAGACLHLKYAGPWSRAPDPGFRDGLLCYLAFLIPLWIAMYLK